MPEKWYIRIIELLGIMQRSRSEGTQFDEEEVLLYHNLCKLISTWSKVQEISFKMAVYNQTEEFKKLKKQLGISDDDDECLIQ